MRTILTLLLFVPLFGFSQYWQQQGQDIDGEASGDASGWSVSMNDAGDRVAIGAPYNDGNGSSPGHVRIYDWNGTSWTQQGQDIDGEAFDDQSGYSVSINAAGDRVAIGAPKNDGSGPTAGHVRVYEWDGSTWAKLGQDIDGEASNVSGPQVGDYSGWSVSINASGDKVAIGAPWNVPSNGGTCGHVRVYSWNGTSWIQQGQDIDGESSGVKFGWSVSMNSAGDKFAVGVPLEYGTAHQSGYVRIYEWNGSSWTRQGQNINGQAVDERSGTSVSMNAVGDRVAIGATYNYGNGIYPGKVRIFAWIGSSWVQQGQDIIGETPDDFFGYSVSMNALGDRLAIGAYTNGGNGVNSGHVRIYDWNGTSWIQQGQDIDGESAGDIFGCSVTMNASGNLFSSGAYGNDGNGSNSGHAQTYSCNTELTDDLTVCDSASWIDGNTYYSSTYNPTYIIGPNSKGCDSIKRLNLSVNYSNTSVDNLIACNSSFTWIDGNTYTADTNNINFTVSNIHGCDSVVTLNLTFNNPNVGTDIQTACDSYNWIDGNTYTNSTNLPTYTLTNTAGCDSVITLDLTINYSSTSNDVITACGSYTWINGVTYTSNGSAIYTVPNSVGCDSTVFLDVTINQAQIGIINNSPTLSAVASNATYQWLDCNNNYAPIAGETNQSFTATANGSYAVEVTQNGCVDTSACKQVNNVGINEINSSITLHPNPTTGIVELQGINGSFKVDVYDYAGKYLQSTTRSTIDLSDYPSGIYLLKVAYGDKTEELRVLKE